MLNSKRTKCWPGALASFPFTRCIGGAALARALLGVGSLLVQACATHRPPADLGRLPRGEAPTGVDLQAGFAEASGLGYVLTLPPGEAPEGGWPLIVFLHSLEERGDLLARVVEHADGQGRGLAAIALDHPEWPTLTLSPLCPRRSYWFREHARLIALIDEVADEWGVDPDRIALTGVSMGGMGVWSLATAHPDRFSALAPIAGGVYSPPMSGRVEVLSDVPMWAIHDRRDPSIPLAKEQPAIDRLRQAGGDVRQTLLDTGEHYVHEAVYDAGELVRWLLAQERP